MLDLPEQGYEGGQSTALGYRPPAPEAIVTPAGIRGEVRVNQDLVQEPGKAIRKRPKSSIQYPRTSEMSHRNAEVHAKRAGFFTRVLESGG